MADNKIEGRTGGILSFTLDGTPYEIEGSVTFQPYRFMRTSTTGLTGPTGHKRESTQPFIEVTMPYKKGVDLAVLANAENVVGQLDMYNGESWVMQQGAQVGTLEPDADEGTVTVRLESPVEMISI